MPHPKIKGNIIGKQVKKYRAENSMTQAQLSAALSVDQKIDLAPDLISRIESGERTVRDKEIAALCKVLNISADQIFGW